MALKPGSQGYGCLKPIAPGFSNIGMRCAMSEDTLKFIETGKDWYTLDALRQANVKREWLVKGFMSTPALSVIYGNNGSAKTTIILDMAMSITQGIPWLAQFPTKQGSVLWFNEDMMLPDFKERVTALENGRKKKASNIFIADNLGINIDPDSKDYQWTLQEIVAAYTQVKPVMIVIDHLRAVIGGKNANNDADTAPILKNLRTLAKTLNTCFVVMHHSNKGGGYSGSTDIPAKTDFAYRFTKKDKNTFLVDNKERQRFGEVNLQVNALFEEKDDTLISASFSLGEIEKKTSYQDKFEQFIGECIPKLPMGKTALAHAVKTVSYKTALEYLKRAIDDDIFNHDGKNITLGIVGETIYA